jgi:TctA family transporter
VLGDATVKCSVMRIPGTRRIVFSSSCFAAETSAVVARWPTLSGNQQINLLAPLGGQSRIDYVVTQSGAALNNSKNQVDTVVVSSLLSNAEYLELLHKHLRRMMTKTALHPNNMENGDMLIQIVQERK